ncbi:MAG: cysteine synthase A [Anaerolineales bacterium]|jgi:cysteine synthase A
MNCAQSLTDLIGNTPLLRLARFLPFGEFYAKCEFMNPGSLKDRPVLQIIQDAERSGRISPGDTLIETTSGNTGIAVAYIAAIKGYRAILVMSEIQSLERRNYLKALGAELILTPASEGTRGAREEMHNILARHPEYFYIGQHVNPSNPAAHYRTTGPEIWTGLDGNVNILIAGLGTGGTICGAGKYLKEHNREIKLIAVEPAESPFISQGKFRPHRMMGTAPGFVPETLEREIIDEILLISEQQAFTACNQIARTEGLLVGISSGAVAHAAQKIAGSTSNSGKVIVGIFADRGERYLSVEGLFD